MSIQPSLSKSKMATPPHMLSMMNCFSGLPQVRWKSIPEDRVASEKEISLVAGSRFIRGEIECLGAMEWRFAAVFCGCAKPNNAAATKARITAHENTTAGRSITETGPKPYPQSEIGPASVRRSEAALPGPYRVDRVPPAHEPIDSEEPDQQASKRRLAVALELQ